MSSGASHAAINPASVRYHHHLPTMDSPTALFDSYEQDFQQIIASIRDKLEGDGKDDRGGTSSSPLVCCALVTEACRPQSSAKPPCAV